MSKRDKAITPPEGYKRLSNLEPEDIAHIMRAVPEDLTPTGAAELIINMLKLRGLEERVVEVMATVMVALSDNATIISHEVDVDELHMGRKAN